MVGEGDTAPSFTLPGIANKTDEQTFCLQESTDQDRAVLLLFYPFDFSPVCTNELCAIRDAEWFELTPELDVWAISGDSAYAHRAFADEYDLRFPLLSDYAGSVAADYGVQYDTWEGHDCVPKRSVVLINGDRTVHYTWQTENAFEQPDFFPVHEALQELQERQDTFTLPEMDVDVDYEENPTAW